MPFKSSTKTLKKKSLKNTQKKKSGTAKRSKNKSRKGGAKTKKTPSPSPESSGEDIDNYEIPKDLLPEEYTEELQKEDEKYVREVLDNFYENDEVIKELKGMKTDTRAQRLKKKIFLVKKEPSLIPVLPEKVEDTIFKEINERQDKLDNYAAKKEIRDKEFEKLISILEDERENRKEYGKDKKGRDVKFYTNKIQEMEELWKPEEHFEFNAIETAIFGEDPVVQFEEAKEHRIRYVEEYIRDKYWNEGWIKAVEEKEKNPDSGRKLTDILIEDWLVPRCVDKYYGATYDEGHGDFSYSDEMYMIQDWNNAWIKANEDEYQKSDEFKKDEKKKEDKKKKEEAEKKKEEEEYQKYIKNAEEKKKREIAAAAEKRTRDAEADESKHNKKQKLRERARMKKAMAEAALRPKTPVQKRKVGETTEMLPEPPAQKIRVTTMPPAAGDGPTTSTETISFKDADSLARKNSNIKIRQSKTHPGNYYTVNPTKNEFTWIIPIELFKNQEDKLYYMDYADQKRYIDNFARIDAERAKSNEPDRFEIRTYSTPQIKFDYLINKELGVISKIFD
tara:strand:+ start:313 stop:1998 length:1686 start_codon:yes stop_codon:yes gene_type:complete